MRNIVVAVVIFAISAFGYRLTTRKSPEETAFEQKIKDVSLEGKVEDFEIEGASHVSIGQSVSYNTNPPTSGSHYAQSANWGFYDKKLQDEQLVHNLEHGGIWISYTELENQSLEKLKEISKKNKNSVIVTNRPQNEDPIVVASWGKIMRLTEVNEALIQKYINTYINQSPEKLAL